MTFEMLPALKSEITVTDLQNTVWSADAWCYLVRVDDGTTRQVAASDGRVGIAFNADAQWGDFDGTVEGLRAAVNDYLNDADAWEARN